MTKTEQREVTAAFAGGALALVALGALLSLRWFGRLVLRTYGSFSVGPLDCGGMRKIGTRSVFAGALCAGVAMVGRRPCTA